MKLVVYDKNNGSLVMTMENSNVECDCINIEEPEGKHIVSYDVILNKPVYEDKPLSLEERIALLESSQTDQDDAIDELATIVGGE